MCCETIGWKSQLLTNILGGVRPRLNLDTRSVLVELSNYLVPPNALDGGRGGGELQAFDVDADTLFLC